ncbi:MAG: DUF3380 domain-containing protein [Rhodobiaceae bacterium]|nr:DUF3380 domain-containing protein [Rhodobiaceae bacterium]
MKPVIDQLEAGTGKRGGGKAAIEAAAKRLRCEAAVLHAVIEVESGGDPFDPKRRLIILPEKHIFWRYLPKSLRAIAQRRGLATPKWSRANYNGLGGKGSDARWTRLRAMCELHEEAGLKSASYGAPQIMGFNHKLCGYGTVTAFVLAMAASEKQQIEAFIAFLEAVGLADELRRKDFKAIARRYNGSGQVAHYAAMMQRAYARIRKRGPKMRASATEIDDRLLRLGSEGYRVKALQERLQELGYHTQADGDYGPATRRQVVAFQADHGLATDGVVGPSTETALEKAVPITHQPGDTRGDLTVHDLRERGSQTVKSADGLTTVGGGTIAIGAGAEIMDKVEKVEEVSGVVERIRYAVDPFLGFIADHKWLVLIVVGVAVIYLAHRIKKRRLFDAITWRHVG